MYGIIYQAHNITKARKGITFEELFGKKRADEIKNNRSKILKGRN